MKLGFMLAALLVLNQCFAKDWLFVTTNWNDIGNESVAAIDSESGQIRILWRGGGELDAIVSPDGTRLCVSYIGDKGYELAVVDTATGNVLEKLPTPPIIRWIHPSTPGMAISPDGRWLYLLKTNYAAGSNEYSLLTFDTRESRFGADEKFVSQCVAPRAVPLGASAVVVCRGGSQSQAAGSATTLRFEHFVDFALGRGGAGSLIYLAASNGQIQAVDVATHDVVQTRKDQPSRYRLIRPSSDTISPDGRLWYLPIKIPNNGQQEIEQILVFDTQAMRTAGVITPPCAFDGLALSPDGRRLYASQHEQRKILVIDAQTHKCVRMIRLGAKPSIILSAKAQ